MKDAKWSDLTRAAHNKHIDLTATYLFKPTDTQGYSVWGLSCAEIETDILTGNIQLRRVDILEDTGESMSPLLDVGQVQKKHYEPHFLFVAPHYCRLKVHS